jgi:hypothetical protein
MVPSSFDEGERIGPNAISKGIKLLSSPKTKAIYMPAATA